MTQREKGTGTEVHIVRGCTLLIVLLALEHKWAGFATLIKGAKSPSKINPISLGVIETIFLLCQHNIEKG